MTKYRHRYFFFGLLLVLLGVQFRMVDSFVLNESTTRTLARFSQTTTATNTSSMVDSILLRVHPKPMKRVEPPRWLGLSMIAFGTVITLHAFAIPRE
ncbi:hypothetical protein Pla52o_48480 [Novipirellula galeiformis]|uniref:Uncharacterized protein n=1 Tax=Novipirellula galeiformis TaxID=2528004 RepID=A0A5C6BZF7_9BACT|nr:hypothetical protein [Novipirellula galeiformis]TWU17633.1 hypothetical protein Pla52o_48480 [Novipirellula galeiformis]